MAASESVLPVDQTVAPNINTATPEPSSHEFRKIAAVAECEVRTVRRYFVDRQSVRPTSASAITRALRKLGITDPHGGKAR